MKLESKNFETFVANATTQYQETYNAIRENRDNKGGFAEAQVDVEEKQGKFGYVSVRAYAEVTNIRVTYQCAQGYAEVVVYPDGKTERIH